MRLCTLIDIMNNFLVQTTFFLIFLSTAFSRPRDLNRCVNMWDEGCVNGQLPGSGQDNDYVNGGFNPGKRCVNMWDEGCVNGQLPGSGQDDDYVNGGFNPGKRWVPSTGGNTVFQNFDEERKLHELMAKIYKMTHI